MLEDRFFTWVAMRVSRRAIFRLIAIALMSCISVACSASNSDVRAEGADLSGNSGKSDPMTMNIINNSSSTFQLEIGDEVRQTLKLHLEGGSLKIARLVIRDVYPQAAKDLKGVRIFIENPDADANTTIDDQHYISSFVLGLEDVQSLQFNIAPTLSRLWHAGIITPAHLDGRKKLQVTFVPIHWDFVTAFPTDFALTFKSLTLEVPNQ